jgi:triosephosphate isomerase
MKDLGVNWTLAGNSERRIYFDETDNTVAVKTRNAV